MKRDLIVAAIQLNSTADKAKNISDAERLVREAASHGAELIALPELFAMIAPFHEMVAAAESIPGPTSQHFSALARELSVMIAAGSICEAADAPDRGYNASLLFDSQGSLLAKYRKIHLFEVNLAGQVAINEANYFDAGNEVSVVDTAFGKVAQGICYDLRFPRLFSAFADRDADIALLPSAFTKVTGAAHWSTLVKARAIENQMFVVAPNQVGKHNDDFISYGHSLIVDPWGDVLAEADGTGAQVITAELKRERLDTVRKSLPVLSHRAIV